MIRVSNIQRFATHDGPGIRTVVFFKGCPLHCPWCANPETWHDKKEILHDTRKCTLCRRCEKVCPNHALSVGGSWTIDRSKCVGCGKCEKACLNDALELVGADMYIDEVIAEIMKDDDYYEASGGGVTLSGGEVFRQDPLPLLKKLKELNYDVTVETEGAYTSDRLIPCIPYIDRFYFDLKSADAKKLKRITGADLDQVLQSIRSIDPDRVTIRVPVIPGFNDQEIPDIIEMVSKLGVKTMHLLPYHAFGKGKWHRLGRPYIYEDEPAMDRALLEPYKQTD